MKRSLPALKTKLQGVTPHLDEGAILRGLGLSITPETARVVRQSTVNMLMTCIDRKLKDRFYMADVIADVVNITDMIRRVSMLGEFAELLEDTEHPVDVKLLKTRMEEYLAAAEDIRKGLFKRMQVVAQMAYEDDIIH